MDILVRVPCRPCGDLTTSLRINIAQASKGVSISRILEGPLKFIKKKQLVGSGSTILLNIVMGMPRDLFTKTFNFFVKALSH